MKKSIISLLAAMAPFPLLAQNNIPHFVKSETTQIKVCPSEVVDIGCQLENSQAIPNFIINDKHYSSSLPSSFYYTDQLQYLNQQPGPIEYSIQCYVVYSLSNSYKYAIAKSQIYTLEIRAPENCQ